MVFFNINFISREDDEIIAIVLSDITTVIDEDFSNRWDEIIAIIVTNITIVIDGNN